MTSCIGTVRRKTAKMRYLRLFSFAEPKLDFSSKLADHIEAFVKSCCCALKRVSVLISMLG